jgi:fumarate reductase subunit C
MKKLLTYPDYHSRLYRPRVSTYWWLWRWPYMKFILRELSSVPIAYFVVFTLLLLRALSRGPEAYAEFQEWLKSPWLIVLNVITLFFVLFHTITWFNLAPRAMVVRVRGRRVPDLLIAASNYVAWLVVSAVVAWFILGG